jgi:hypothetical protein
MIYLTRWKLFESKSIREIQITKKCNSLGLKNWTLNPETGLVDVDGDVNISKMNLTSIPIRFGVVTGDFSCYENNLITLDGSPKQVGGTFYCDNNKITSLVGGPTSVTSYNCASNKLVNFEGSPDKVKGFFHANLNPLKSLIGSPKWIGGDYSIEVSDGNIKISNIVLATGDSHRGILLDGMPVHVGGRIISNNSLIKLIFPNAKFNDYDSELLKEYDFVREEGVIIDRLVAFLEDSHGGYKEEDLNSTVTSYGLNPYNVESFRENIIRKIKSQYKIIE